LTLVCDTASHLFAGAVVSQGPSNDSPQRLTYEGQFVSAVRQYENYYEYDAAGNRTLLRHGETGAENLTYYEYDAANELSLLTPD